MQLRTDDEVYRVDAVWLGPPKATFPWQARYVAYGIGITLFLALLWGERQLGIGFGFFSTVWAAMLAIAITRWAGRWITHERPLTAVAQMWAHELATPRGDQLGTGARADLSRLRVSTDRPRPKRARQTTADTPEGG